MVTHDYYSALPQHWDSVCGIDTDDNHVRNARKTMHAYIISTYGYFLKGKLVFITTSLNILMSSQG